MKAHYETFETPEWISWWDKIPPEARNTLFSTPRVLVIDDDPLFCKKVERIGKKMGVRVQTCCSLENVAALDDKHPFDVAIIDYFFGDMTGTQLAYLIGKTTPIILTSTAARSEIQESDWPKAVRTFIPKTTGVETLLETALKLTGLAAIQQTEATLSKNMKMRLLILLMMIAFALLFMMEVQSKTPEFFYWDEAPIHLDSQISQSRPLQNGKDHKNS